MNDGFNYSEQKNQQYPEPQPMQIQHHPQPMHIQHHPQPSSSLSPPFMKQCCCFSLKTGCLIIGWLSLFFAVFGTIVMSVMGSSTEGIVSKQIENDPILNRYNDDDVTDAAFMTVIIVTIVILAIMALSDIFLLIGVYKEKTVLLKTFLIITCIILGLSISGFIKMLVAGGLDTKTAIRAVASYIWMIFNIVVVYCYHRELQIKQMTTPVINSSPPSYEP